jgi:hypothetical protein
MKNTKGILRAILLAVGCAVALLAHASPNDDLFRAILNYSLDQTRAAIAAGADIDALSPGTNTMLMEAIRRGRVEIALLLIERGASLEKSNRNRVNALMAAQYSDDEGIRTRVIPAMQQRLQPKSANTGSSQAANGISVTEDHVWRFRAPNTESAQSAPYCTEGDMATTQDRSHEIRTHALENGGKIVRLYNNSRCAIVEFKGGLRQVALVPTQFIAVEGDTVDVAHELGEPNDRVAFRYLAGTPRRPTERVSTGRVSRVLIDAGTESDESKAHRICGLFNLECRFRVLANPGKYPAAY